MKRLVPGVLFGAGVVLLGATACGSDSKLPVGADQPVYIEGIEPSSATIGDEIVIRGHGFLPHENDVGFIVPGRESRAFSVAYETLIPSSDGRTLRVEIRDMLGACAYSQMKPGEVCPSIGVPVSIGELSIAVYNRHGVSNPVMFTREISPQEKAESEIWGSTDMKEMLNVLDENTQTSISPYKGLWLEGYGIGIERRQDDFYISLQLQGSNLEKIVPALPHEIAGYKVIVLTPD